MEKSQLAILEDQNVKEAEVSKTLRLGLALDTITELLNIEFGSMTVHFYKGKWCPKIEIQKNVLAEINQA